MNIMHGMEKETKEKTAWQLLKFLLVGGIGAVLQLAVVNILYFALKSWTTPLPNVLASIFSESTMGKGNSNWGYVLPFFVSNLASNTYQYFQNRKTTFKASAPTWCFAVYIAVLVILIFIATWLQGVLNNLFIRSGLAFIEKLAPTLAVLLAGAVYTIVLFPLEKYVLFKPCGKAHV